MEGCGSKIPRKLRARLGCAHRGGGTRQKEITMFLRKGVVAVAALTAVLATPITTQAGGASTRAPAAIGRDDGGEYVVSYDTTKAEQAMQAIAAAGGTVVDVQS